ncbi:GNAT family N-acetyltransferase [Pseudoroseicyclus sp. H15]
MWVKGRYQAREATNAGDLAACQRLRHLCFVERAGGAPRPGGLDSDDFDAACRHVMIEEQRGGRLVACFRLLPLQSGAEIGLSYSAQFYDLSALAAFEGPMMELGRFCLTPELNAAEAADVLRIAWGAMTCIVETEGAEMLFGCSSFAGTDSEAYLDAFTMLGERHLAPRRFLPRIKAPSVYPFAEILRRRVPDRRRGRLGLPPLLKTYLAMGGWVSDHAVVDHDMNTLHVFTGLEIGAIPAARVKALRAVAG